MNIISRTLGIVALALAGFSLQAEDFSPLMQVVQTTWPEKTHIGVICDYHSSRAQVEALAQAAGPDSKITVVDTYLPERAEAGANLVANRKADFVVLLPKDRLFHDGSYGATVAIFRLARHGVPAVGTTPKALAQGAVFSVGDGTNGEVLVNNQIIGTVTVTLPQGITYSRKASLPLSGGMAKIVVFPAR